MTNAMKVLVNIQCHEGPGAANARKVPESDQHQERAGERPTPQRSWRATNAMKEPEGHQCHEGAGENPMP